MSTYSKWHKENREHLTNYNRTWREKNPEKAKANRKAWEDENRDKVREYNRKSSLKRTQQTREYGLMRNHGITWEEYSAMLEKQGGGCAICGGQNTKRKKILCVDHDHDTGKIRGLLCDSCNRGLGMLGDSLSHIMNVVKYLEESG